MLLGKVAGDLRQGLTRLAKAPRLRARGRAEELEAVARRKALLALEPLPLHLSPLKARQARTRVQRLLAWLQELERHAQKAGIRAFLRPPQGRRAGRLRESWRRLLDTLPPERTVLVAGYMQGESQRAVGGRVFPQLSARAAQRAASRVLQRFRRSVERLQAQGRSHE